MKSCQVGNIQNLSLRSFPKRRPLKMIIINCCWYTIFKLAAWRLSSPQAYLTHFKNRKNIDWFSATIRALFCYFGYKKIICEGDNISLEKSFGYATIIDSHCPCWRETMSALRPDPLCHTHSWCCTSRLLPQAEVAILKCSRSTQGRHIHIWQQAANNQSH